MKATSAPSRARRLPSAERMVAASRLATASRKPKSRDSRAAPSSSPWDLRAQMRLNTVEEAVSSPRTARSALAVITT